MREKQEIELRNTQLVRDLENLRTSTAREINGLNAQLVQLRGQLSSCTEGSSTLQTQLITVRSENKDSQELQQQFNVCQETLRNTRNQVTRLDAQVREISVLQSRLETATNQLTQTRDNLRSCSDENKQLATTA